MTTQTNEQARTDVLAMVRDEMDRTDDNAWPDPPTRDDYIADLVRYLNNQLQDQHRFFEGDWSWADD
jgi:hypothetical protein